MRGRWSASGLLYSDLPSKDETFAALEDSEVVALATSDDAPNLVDELDTDEQV